MAAPSWNEFLASRGVDWQIAAEFPGAALAELQAEYLNTYGSEGIESLKAAGVSLPQTYVDPSREAEYRGYFDEHVAAGRYTPDQWEEFKKTYMGDENTPAQGGRWAGGEGGLTFIPNVPQGSYRDTGNWLSNFTGALPNVLNAAFNPGAPFEALRKSHGIADVVDTLFDPMSGQFINASLGAVGSAIKDEPGLQSAVGVLGPTVGGVAGSVIPGVGSAIGAAVGKGVAGKILGEPNEQNFLGALKTYAAAMALQGLGDVAGDALGGGLTDPDLYEIAMGPDWQTGGGLESGFGFGGAAPIGAEPGILQQIGDFLPSGDTAGQVLDTVGVLSQLAGGSATEELPELPSLLTPLGPEEPLPDLPERVSLAIPEGLTFPDIAPYLPKNWDNMSDAEKESWMITRGGELAKRRRGTWAGNLGGIRGGTDNLEYAELIGMTGGKQILGE
jgi:hypothetical protein